MSKVFNFSAGPAMIFPEVLHKAQAELTNWLGQGVCNGSQPPWQIFYGIDYSSRKRSARSV